MEEGTGNRKKSCIKTAARHEGVPIVGGKVRYQEKVGLISRLPRNDVNKMDISEVHCY